MPMLKDISIWRVAWSLTTMNIRMQEMPLEQEASKTALIEHIKRPQDAAIWTVARHLFVQTVVVNVWAATLLGAVKELYHGKKKIKL